jgi:ABC-2 type transport system permease protein
MSIRRTLAITARLLSQFRHDHRTLAILFVTPLIVLGLFALLLRTDAPAPRVGVVADGGAFATAIGDELGGSDDLEVVAVGSTSEADVLLRSEDLDAYVVLPAAPGADGVLRPEVVLEGTDPQVGAIVGAALQQAVL